MSLAPLDRLAEDVVVAPVVIPELKFRDVQRIIARIWWIAGIALLAGCSVAPAPSAKAICPAVAPYTPAENAAIAAELAKLSPGDVLLKVANEDHRLRVELEACRE